MNELSGSPEHEARAGAKRVAAAAERERERAAELPRLTTLAEDASQRRRRQTSRRQRKQHAVAMGALALLDSAEGAEELQASIAVATQHVHALPVLQEELECARARLQSLETAAGAEAAAPAISLDELRAATANWNLDSKVGP